MIALLSKAIEAAGVDHLHPFRPVRVQVPTIATMVPRRAFTGVKRVRNEVSFR